MSLANDITTVISSIANDILELMLGSQFMCIHVVLFLALFVFGIIVHGKK